MDIQKNNPNPDSSGKFSATFFDDHSKNTVKTYQPKKQKRNFKKITFYFVLGALAIVLIWGVFLFLKLYSTGQKITIKNDSSLGSALSSFISSENKTLRGEENGRINILLLGAAGKGKPGQNLTDTVMIASLDTKSNRVALLSLPRDLYVKIPDTKSYTKINSLYQYGLHNDQGADPIRKSVEEITGLEINYFAIVDFAGFTKVIDDLGGITVQNERDILDTRFPGPGYSYETFKLAKGSQHLDGATALKYVRERHNDPDGDFGRAKRQQQVIQAVKNKAFSLGTFFNVFAVNNLLSDLGDNVKTDIAMDELESFIALSRKADTQNIVNVVADAWEKDSLLKVSHTFFGSQRAFILVPRVGSYSEIHDLASNIFDLDAIRRRKSEIEKESAEISIINQSGEPALLVKIKTLLKDKLKLKVISAENSKIVSDQTTVSDQTNGQKLFTLDELIKKLPATLSEEKSDIMTKADLTIRLGKDLIIPYGFEEDSIEEFKNAQDNQEYLVQ
jgi:LCP family protein required for cell wall assembly